MKRTIPDPITLQNQPTWNSCMSTCLAMLLDVPAMDIINEYHDDYVNGTGDSPSEYLALKGLKMHLGKSEMMLLYGNVYKLSVPSLNVLGLNHAIIVDTRNMNFKVYDPNHGKLGKKFYTNEQSDFDKYEGYAHQIMGFSIDLMLYQQEGETVFPDDET